MSTKQAVVGIVGKVPRNEQARVEKWNTFVRQTVENAQVLGNAGETEDARCLENSVDGGDCPRCEVPWEEVTVDNPFVKGSRYRPACDCLPRWTEREHKFDDGSTAFETKEVKEVLYETRCDACHKNTVMMNHQRRHRGYRGHHAIYERVLCPSCSRGKS